MFSAVLPQRHALKMPLGHEEKLFLNLLFCLDLMVKSVKQHPFTSNHFAMAFVVPISGLAFLGNMKLRPRTTPVLREWLVEPVVDHTEAHKRFVFSFCRCHGLF